MKQNFWISLYFNNLSIEVIAGSRDRARAVLAGRKQQDRVLMCNPVASSLGIRPGLSVNAALALVPGLEVVFRDTRLETQTLQKLATWATRFTPAVSIDSPNALLLDIHASLKFFGGLVPLQKRLIHDLDHLGYEVTFACAPTALGALWLARTGPGSVVLESSELSGRLAVLPIECLYWSEKSLNMLRGIGVRFLGELVRLPRDGLAQRIGPEKLLELDRGFGRQPEPRKFYQPAKRFYALRELSMETVDSRLLLESLRVLLGRLREFLLLNQGSIQVLWLSLHHYSEPATLIRIGLLRPATNTTYLLDLIRIRFDGFLFSAPVISVAVQTDLAGGFQGPAKDLFGSRADSAAEALELVEQLRARLGSPAVHGIQRVSEHRPEAAWKAVNPSEQMKHRDGRGLVDDKTGHRPFWMLVKPLALEAAGDRPVFLETLDLEDGPERIEAGWWDGDDVRRDYYVARNLQGMQLWVFKDCRESRWYLHGLFG
jgi:protein ImuB